MLKSYLNQKEKFFLAWENGRGDYSFIEAIENNIQGSRQLDRKARKILNDGWQNVQKLKSYGKITGQNNDLEPIHYIKDRSSGIRAPFFKIEENVFIGIFVFYKQNTDQENQMFERSESDQEDIINWIEKNEELYKKLIQRSE